MTTAMIDQEDILENFLNKGPTHTWGVVLPSATAEGCAKELFNDIVNCEIRVVDDRSYRELTYVYNKARSWKKCIEDVRKRLSEPYRMKTTEINNRAKSLTSILDTIISDANEKTCSYLQLLEQQRKKREEDLKLKASLLDLDEECVAPVATVIPSGSGATIITRKTTKFRVTDDSKIPRQYLMVNEEAVEAAIKLGMLEIPGIEIYEETTTSLRKTF